MVAPHPRFGRLLFVSQASSRSSVLSSLPIQAPHDDRVMYSVGYACMYEEHRLLALQTMYQTFRIKCASGLCTTCLHCTHYASNVLYTHAPKRAKRLNTVHSPLVVEDAVREAGAAQEPPHVAELPLEGWIHPRELGPSWGTLGEKLHGFGPRVSPPLPHDHALWLVRL